MVNFTQSKLHKVLKNKNNFIGDNLIYMKKILLGLPPILVFITCVACVIILSKNITAQPESGLVGYWKFDEGSGGIAYDSSGNNNNGILHNVIWINGKINKALGFDGGDSHANVSDSYNLNITSSITIEAWVYPFTTSGRREIASKNTAYLFNLQDGKICSNMYGVNGVFNCSEETVASNAWSHVAMTYDGSVLKLYINGQLDSSFSVSGKIRKSSNPLTIGLQQNNLGSAFSGVIDEVRIYNKSLEENEIKSHYIEELKFHLLGRLTDENDSPIQANVAVYNQGTNDINSSSITDSSGNYNVATYPGIYDVKYSISNFFIPDFWILLSSERLNFDKYNIVNHLSYNSNEVLNRLSFTLNSNDEQTIQTYSPTKPRRILISGVEINEAASLAELKDNSWFYDSNENKLHIKAINSTQGLVLKREAGTKYFNDMSAETIAGLYDMVQAWSKDEEKIRLVKYLRPDFKPLLYRSIREISNVSEEWQTFVENNWLLKDKDGNYVYCTIWPKNYMVDIANPDYQTWVANWIKEHIELYGYDGVYADCSFHSVAGEQWYALSSKPLNPRTGTYWTDEEVRQANIQQFNAIRNAIGPSKPIVVNGIYQGTRFSTRREGYLEVLSNSPIDGITFEGMWYQYEGVWPTEQEWLNSLSMLIWFQDNFLKSDPNRLVLPMCKMERMDGVQYTFPADSTQEQMATYAFASTLLGIKTSQTYLSLHSNVSFATQKTKPLFDIGTGTPLSDYYMIEDTHVYARDFSNAKVLVNPTDSAYTVTLDGSYKTLSGEMVTAITMTNHTGEILLGL